MRIIMTPWVWFGGLSDISPPEGFKKAWNRVSSASLQYWRISKGTKNITYN
jgi:hypothetical protein